MQKQLRIYLTFIAVTLSAMAYGQTARQDTIADSTTVVPTYQIKIKTTNLGRMPYLSIPSLAKTDLLLTSKMAKKIYAPLSSTGNYVKLFPLSSTLYQTGQVNITDGGAKSEMTGYSYHATIPGGTNATYAANVAQINQSTYQSQIQAQGFNFTNGTASNTMQYNTTGDTALNVGGVYDFSGAVLHNVPAALQDNDPVILSQLTAGYVPSTRTISTGYGLSGGGDLSANRTLLIDTSLIAKIISNKDIVANSYTAPNIYGGTAAASKLTYTATTGTGTSGGVAHQFNGGTNGGTTIGRFYNDGKFAFGSGSSTQSLGEFNYTTTLTTSQRTTRHLLNLNLAANGASVSEAIFANAKYTATSSFYNTGAFSGVYALAETVGDGRYAQIQGVLGEARSGGNLTTVNSDVQSLYGGRFYSQNLGLGYTGHLVGVKIGQNVNNGVSDVDFGLYIMQRANTGTGTTTRTAAVQLEGILDGIDWGNNDGSGGNKYIKGLSLRSLEINSSDSLKITGPLYATANSTSAGFRVNNTGAGNLALFQAVNVPVAGITPSGRFTGSGMSSLTSIAKGTITFGTTITAARDTADTSPSFVVNNVNASNTGSIIQLQSGGSSVASVTKSGIGVFAKLQVASTDTYSTGGFLPLVFNTTTSRFEKGAVTGTGSFVLATGPTLTNIRPATTFQSATGGTTDSVGFWNAQRHVSKALVAGAGVNITQTASSVTIATTSGTPVEISGTSQTASANTAYIPHNASLTTITLPTTTVVGTLFQVIGEGSGGWRIQLASGQVIKGVGSFSTTSGGTVSSTDRYCTITIRLVAANTFVVTTSQGTLTPA